MASVGCHILDPGGPPPGRLATIQIQIQIFYRFEVLNDKCRHRYLLKIIIHLKIDLHDLIQRHMHLKIDLNDLIQQENFCLTTCRLIKIIHLRYKILTDFIVKVSD